MKETHRLRLLTIDSAINLLLGLALLFVPKATIAFFGLPRTDAVFYVSVLGAVLFGIGIALWMERKNDERCRGLGLPGAVAINLLGGGTVLVWLVIDPFTMPVRGYLVLWIVTILVVATAAAELFVLTRHRSE